MQAPIIERMLNVFDPHLSAPDEKTEFVLPNPGEICKHLAGAYSSNSHNRRLLLSYFCMRKKAWKSIQWRESFKEICLRKLSIINPL